MKKNESFKKVIALSEAFLAKCAEMDATVGEIDAALCSAMIAVIELTCTTPEQRVEEAQDLLRKLTEIIEDYAGNVNSTTASQTTEQLKKIYKQTICVSSRK